MYKKISAALIAILIATASLPTQTQAQAPCTSGSVTSQPRGFYGSYYNLALGDPGTQSYPAKAIPNPTAGPANYWFSPAYHSFSRVDESINFGKNFFPLDEGKSGDPYHFAVHWESTVLVSETTNYQISMTSDDDSWLYIDGKLVIDLNGTHKQATRKISPVLKTGQHKIDVYYAERAPYGSMFGFVADSRLNSYATVACAGSTGSGRVLGVSTESGGTSDGNTSPTASLNAKYTPAVALYRTAASPDIYAIYANGYRHFVSSPTAFARYGYRFSDVRTVSDAVLKSHPNARLVRTPNDATIYYLSSRPQGQWLKLAIPSPTVFVSYAGNYWGNVIVVDELDVAHYPNAILLASPSGDYYLLEGPEKRTFTSLDVLIRLGYNPAEAIHISEEHLNAYPAGDPIG